MGSGPFERASLELVTLVVDDYDDAITFFVDVLGFTLVEDSPSETNDGRPKRWVVVRPAQGGTALLLARADGADQAAAVGNQAAGRVTFFLRVHDFDAAHRHLVEAGVPFTRQPFDAPYGRCAVFRDVAGNKWDLLGPPTTEEIVGLEMAFADAVQRKDLDLLERLLGEDFTLTTGREGTEVRSREEWLRVTEHEYVVEEHEFEELVVQDYGTCAVARSRYRQRGRMGEQARNTTYRMTDVWIRMEDGWKLQARHAQSVEGD